MLVYTQGQNSKDANFNRSSKRNIILNTNLENIIFDAQNYIAEFKKMWTELSERGCDRTDLNKNDYPLSINGEGEIGSALCNFVENSEYLENCSKCPVRWSNGNCYDLFYDWTSTDKYTQERVIFAKAFLKEIDNKL